MDYGKLQRFAMRHGSVSVISTGGITRSVATSEMATHDLIATADQFLWDGLLRSRAEMEELLAQNERGLSPGCGDCDRLEKELIAARDRDRKEKNLEMRSESPALRSLQEHRRTH